MAQDGQKVRERLTKMYDPSYKRRLSRLIKVSLVIARRDFVSAGFEAVERGAALAGKRRNEASSEISGYFG
jgi:hypothetical protein